MFKNAEELLRFVKQENVQQVDLKVVDLFGRWHRMTYSGRNIRESVFTKGTGISLSPYPGYRAIQQGDMTVIPDPTTAFIDPFFEEKTLTVICDIYLNDGTRYERDPRAIAQRAEKSIASVGLKGRSMWLPEIEFYIFDEARYGTLPNKSFFMVDSEQAYWNADRDEQPSLGFKFGPSGGGQADAPRDRTYNLRSLMVSRIEDAGYPVKYHHHELGSPGQLEIEPFFAPLVMSADEIMVMKYIIKNTAVEYNKTVTFMPKPLHTEPGNGLHFHQYIEKNGKSLFYDPKGYACLNQAALYYIGGLLTHTPALMALTNPGTNSFRRFGVGMAAPMNLFFSESNRSAAVRIPGYAKNAEENRVEYRLPDALCNPYLAMAAQLMAGLDGIRKKIDPTKAGFGPFDVNNYILSDKEKAKMKSTPSSLEEALEALKADCAFLTHDGVFPQEVIDVWIDMKLKNECHLLHTRPHPLEYELYYDL